MPRPCREEAEVPSLKSVGLFTETIATNPHTTTPSYHTMYGNKKTRDTQVFL